MNVDNEWLIRGFIRELPSRICSANTQCVQYVCKSDRRQPSRHIVVIHNIIHRSNHKRSESQNSLVSIFNYTWTLDIAHICQFPDDPGMHNSGDNRRTHIERAPTCCEQIRASLITTLIGLVLIPAAVVILGYNEVMLTLTHLLMLVFLYIFVQLYCQSDMYDFICN